MDVASGSVHDIQIVHKSQTVLFLTPSLHAYCHKLTEMRHDIPSHQQRQLRLAHLCVYPSSLRTTQTIANRVAVGVEEHRQQRILCQIHVHQPDHRLQRVVHLQLLQHPRVIEEEAEEIHDQLGGRGHQRLLLFVSIHRR